VAKRPSILIVDDDDGTRGALTDFFCEEGFAVASAREGESALAVARSAMPDLVLTDLEMPLVGGVELCRRLREMDQDLPVIVMTAHSDLQLAVDSLRVGADDYLTNPSSSASCTGACNVCWPDALINAPTQSCSGCSTSTS
jgi:DNA-binding response OmpR family regulator